MDSQCLPSGSISDGPGLRDPKLPCRGQGLTGALETMLDTSVSTASVLCTSLGIWGFSRHQRELNPHDKELLWEKEPHGYFSFQVTDIPTEFTITFVCFTNTVP